MTKYNGWTNYETWLANLWMGETGIDLATEFAFTVEQIASGEGAETLKSWFDEVFLTDAPETGFLADAINAATSAINWQEIARHAGAE